ncbi:MAG: ABC-F family ATP-binding cassette domain-containing protein [Schleiferiaceae bacterium]|nr:ABC-F family ATP-binding cassette domain-containing protein [Schleiferiaceae bacterium]
MIGINNIGLSFGGFSLFENINFLVNKGNRIGLIGKNGAGKSTLLKIISGRLSPDAGNISKPSGSKIGFLTQDIQQKKGITILDETKSAFVEIVELEQKLEKLNHEISTRTDYESDEYHKLLEDLHTATERFSLIGGYTYEADIERVLMGLGFTRKDFDQNIETFSGGWQMRIELAKLLLQKNDLLLLDEPTNHLDIESIIWLEEFLKQENATVIIVSHDRAFLNNVTNRTIEITFGRIYDYNLPYSKYLALRDDIREKQASAKKNQDKEIAQTEQLIEKFRAKASKASFAQSLIKKLDRMERIEIDEEDTRKMKFSFPPAPRSGTVVAKADDLTKSFGDNTVFSKVNIELTRGQKVAFVGQNGQGKSTLVKILTHQLEFEKGTVHEGHNIKLGYYAQNQADSLDGKKTILQTIEDAADEDTRKKARTILGSFMFTGEDVDKKVSVLSGGERGRLAICKMLLQPINFLVMDEPTNHLDLVSKDVLKQALLNYDGTMIIVSHDRDFLDGLAENVYEFKEGHVKQYLGGIEYFLEQRQVNNLREVEKRAIKKAETPKESSSNKENYKRKKELEKELRKVKNKHQKIEQRIEDLEEEVKSLDRDLQDPEKFKQLSTQPNFYEDYEQKKEDLNEAMTQWEMLSEDIETKETELKNL